MMFQDLLATPVRAYIQHASCLRYQSIIHAKLPMMHMAAMQHHHTAPNTTIMLSTTQTSSNTHTENAPSLTTHAVMQSHCSPSPPLFTTALYAYRQLALPPPLPTPLVPDGQAPFSSVSEGRSGTCSALNTPPLLAPLLPHTHTQPTCQLRPPSAGSQSSGQTAPCPAALQAPGGSSTRAQSPTA